MIFYFTGTGNSLYAAKKLLVDGERLINIAEAIKNIEYGKVTKKRNRYVNPRV